MNSPPRLLALVPLLALLAACTPSAPEAADTPASESPSATGTQSATPSSPAASDTPSATATEQSPSPSATASETGSEVDTSGWETFTAHGISFKHPENWTIRADDRDDVPSPDPDNPYQEWEIVTDQGYSIATFEANSAKDTDGDLGTYQRTTLDTDPVPAELHTPAVFVAEQFVQTKPGDDEKEEKFVMFLSTKERADDRGTGPALSYFMPVAEFYSIFESDDDLPEALGFDEDRVDARAAQEILKSQEYRILKAMMLSVSAK